MRHIANTFLFSPLLIFKNDKFDGKEAECATLHQVYYKFE